MKKPVHSNQAPQAIGPYSQAIATESMVFCSGQIGLDPKTGVMVEGGVEAEARRALDNLSAVLEAAGASMSHVVRTTIYLVNMDDFAKVNAIYGTYFQEPFPARATVAVAALPKGGKVEIDAVAALPPTS